MSCQSEDQPDSEDPNFTPDYWERLSLADRYDLGKPRVGISVPQARVFLVRISLMGP